MNSPNEISQDFHIKTQEALLKLRRPFSRGPSATQEALMNSPTEISYEFHMKFKRPF